MEKENGLINGPSYVIPSINRVKKIQLFIDYQCTLLNSFQLLLVRSVRNKVDFITKLFIDSNCSISAITET